MISRDFRQSVLSATTRANRFSRHLLRAVMLVWQSSPVWMLAALLLSAMLGLLPLALLFLMQRLVDLVVTGIAAGYAAERLFHEALVYILLAAFTSLFESFCRALSGFTAKQQSELVTDHVMALLHAKSIELDQHYYENPGYFDTLHRAQQEAPHLPVIIVNGLMTAGQNTITLCALTSLFILFEPLVVLMLAVSAIPAFMVKLHYSGRHYAQHKQQTPQEREAAYLNWLLTGEAHAGEIRLSGIGPHFLERHKTLRRVIREARLKLTARQLWADLLAQVPALSALFVTLALVVRRVAGGSLTVGSMVMYYQAFQRGQSALGELLSSLATLYDKTLHLSDWDTFLDLEPSVREPEHPVPFPDTLKTGISFNQVSFRYPGSSVNVFDNLTFTIGPGEHVALVGDNGTGKTTLVKLLSRLYDPVSGSITVDGIDIRCFSLADYRSRIGVMLQDYARYHATVKENIRFGNIDRSCNDESVTEAASFAGADLMIRQLPQGYDTMLGKLFKGGTQPSIGQWQKIALARTIYRNSPIMVLDEPSSSLDIKSEHDLFTQFHRITSGRTAILISHRLSAVQMASRILVLVGGTIAESGTHHELLSRNGIYAALYAMQSSYYQLCNDTKNSMP